MNELRLRPYQEDAIAAVFQAWEGGMRRPAVVLPTGAGKTVVFAHLIKQFRAEAAGSGGPSRAIVLVHRDELADQAIVKLHSVAPELSVGKVKAESNQTDADVMVCSVQTLAVKRRLDALVGDQYSVYGPVGLIITDEAHHGLAASYKRVYDAFPDALNLGVTATLQRGDGVGLGSVWDDVVYSRSVLWMISKGFLSDVKTRRVSVGGMDLGKVKSSRGDYQAGDLGRALEESHADEVIARAYLEHAADRPGVVFTPTVATAEAAAAELNAAGIETGVLSGETPRGERLYLFERFRTGRIQVLANCMVLTEGFDAPWASCAVIARPTQSQPLYTQMVGRVLRPYPGKRDALVLDVVGASSSNKLRTLIDLEPGAVQSLNEGELLADAVVREAEAAEQRVPAGSIAFALKHREVDMFAASDVAWLKTPGGVLFISCGDTTVFLWPAKQAGCWTVCTTAKSDRRWRAHPVHRDLDLGSAMAWGEAVAEDHRAFSVQRGASWRKGKPSEGQLNVAASLGLNAAGLPKGVLSDAISVVMGSRQFDRYVSAGIKA